MSCPISCGLVLRVNAEGRKFHDLQIQVDSGPPRFLGPKQVKILLEQDFALESRPTSGWDSEEHVHHRVSNGERWIKYHRNLVSADKPGGRTLDLRGN
jgi:hypothetical protein